MSFVKCEMLFSSRYYYSYCQVYVMYTTLHYLLSTVKELFYNFHLAAFIAEAQLPHNDVNSKSIVIKLLA
jgi:hypothetical protein